MGLVRGEDVILTVVQNQGDTPVQVPFGCARSITFDISTDFIETSVTQSGSFKTFIPSGKQYTGNIEGLVFINKPANTSPGVNATTTIDYSSVSELFPAGFAGAGINVFDPDGFTNLCFLGLDPYATLNDYLTAIVNAINSSGTGYTSIVDGNTIIITARPGLGGDINGSACWVNYNIDGILPPPPNYRIVTYFSGGVSGALNATNTTDFAVFSTHFPTLNSEIIITFNIPPSGTATVVYTETGNVYTNLTDMLNDISNGINSSGTGYTSVVNGSKIITTAPPGYGTTCNGYLFEYDIELDTINSVNSSGFTGGTNGYFPDKLGIGWMYDKLISGEEIFLKYYETDDDNHFLQKQCSVYIESINETSSFDNIVTFSASFKGNGDPIITYGEI